MGIYKFGAWVETVDRGNKDASKRICNERIPDDVGCLFMDMNGIFHNCAQLVYVYGAGVPDSDAFKGQYKPRGKSQPSAKDFEKYNEILKKQKYRQKTIDSKTNEELEHEYMTEIILKISEIINTINPSDTVVMAVDGVAPMAKITQQRKRRYEAAKSDSGKSTARFNSSCISPGTEFMMRLDTVLQQFIAHCVKTSQFRFKNMIYSSHLTAGEGEHKIFHMIRKKHFEIDPYKANVVYGKDADLFMLTLLSEAPLLYLCREDYKMTYNIEAFRDFLTRYMSIKDYFEPDRYQICRDFTVLIFLIGNDFVPATVYFNKVPKVISDMMLEYQNNGKVLTDAEGQIIWSNFLPFLERMAKREQNYLKDLGAIMDTFDYPFPILEQCFSMEKTYNELLETFELVKKIDMDKYKKLWYDRALTPMSEMGKKVIDLEITRDNIDDMCLEYLKAFQWIFQYYTKGQKAVTTRFVYIYHFNPLLSDIVSFIKSVSMDRLPKFNELLKSELDPVITPIHQLICIMPSKSWNLIPQPYRDLMPVRFIDVSPDIFEVIIEAKTEKDKFISTAILNIIDPVRIDRDIRDIGVPSKYKEKPTNYITVNQTPAIPRGPVGVKKLMKDYEKVLQQTVGVVNPKTEEPLTPEEIHEIDYEAKVEPKSAEQVERIIRARIKSRTVKRIEKKIDKTQNFSWVNENLM
jgi:5'-3' exonuclease